SSLFVSLRIYYKVSIMTHDSYSSSKSTTLTRADLYDAVYRQVGLSRAESSNLVEMVLAEIADALARGETVKLSSFGSLVVRAKRARVGRNPKTGVEATITPRRVLLFKPSHVLKARVNGETASEADEKV